MLRKIAECLFAENPRVAMGGIMRQILQTIPIQQEILRDLLVRAMDVARWIIGREIVQTFRQLINWLHDSK